MLDDFFEGILLFFARDPWHVLLDVADIFLVAFLLYRVLVLIRGTRAMQMGVGLALIFVVYQLSRALGLITVWSMLDTLLTYLVLIVVVIFQNDIRRALMRMGRRPFFRSSSERDTWVFEEVVKASQALAQKRVGALIVFERDAALDDFIEPGTSLDALVSKELLYSVFIPSFENPMHDGAVIIREGRVAQAGAFLPLTASPRVDRAFGTRHRAAIGISEETDAVVVVVSEERGQVSLCFNGNVIQDLDAPSLREALLGLFYRAPTKAKRRGRSDNRGRRRTDSLAPESGAQELPADDHAEGEGR